MDLKVLHVTQTTVTGVAHTIRSYIQHQRSQGLEVTLACPRSSDALWLDAVSAGCEVVEWAANRQPSLATLREARDLRRIIDLVDPDIVHLHSSKAGLAGRLWVRDTRPIVFEPNGWSFLAVSGPMRRAALWWERLGAKRTTQAIMVSQAEQRLMKEHRISCPSSYLPNAVDTHHHRRQDADDRWKARRALGVPDVPLAVCVGRLSKQKGQDLLLKAWTRVLNSLPSASLVLVGDGPDRSTLESLAADIPGVLFVGETADPRPWYAASDVVVMPSRWEGMSFVMLEAAAAGRQVVVSDVPGAADLLEGTGQRPIAMEDPDALGHAVANALSSRAVADQHGVVLAARVRSHFDLLERHAAVLQAYQEVAANSGR